MHQLVQTSEHPAMPAVVERDLIDPPSFEPIDDEVMGLGAVTEMPQAWIALFRADAQVPVV